MPYLTSCPYGEIDFVVLIPSGGVVCLEIKGGRVSCKNGIWETIDRFGVPTELKKSPFMQAREGMFALLHAVQGKLGATGEHSRCLFAYAVVFPDIDCPPLSPEFEPWEAIDRNALKNPISKLVLNVLAGKRKQIRGFQQCSESGIRDIRQFLRPDFERIVARPTIVSECESSLIALTEDQYSVLDMISENPRCLIEGAAGTGKTVLALEYSRRQAAEGNKVLLLCFNRLLFFVALIMGAAAFNLFGSLLGGLLIFGSLFLMAQWATRTDPQILRIVLNSAKFRREYDPAKYNDPNVRVIDHA
jgi:hypothetical protein